MADQFSKNLCVQIIRASKLIEEIRYNKTVSGTCIVSPSSSIRRLPALVHGAGDMSSRRSKYLHTTKPDLPLSGQYFTTCSQSRLSNTRSAANHSSAIRSEQFAVVLGRFSTINCGLFGQKRQAMSDTLYDVPTSDTQFTLHYITYKFFNLPK